MGELSMTGDEHLNLVTNYVHTINSVLGNLTTFKLHKIKYLFSSIHSFAEIFSVLQVHRNIENFFSVFVTKIE